MKSVVKWVYAVVGVLIVFAIIISIYWAYRTGILATFIQLMKEALTFP